MTLREKQAAFTFRVGKLILKAYELGYELTFGEAFRPQVTADIYASQGKGIKDSLHELRLAIDLMLFKDGKYLTLNDEYRELGVYWESLSDEKIECCWGGRFNDGNHFSAAWGNRK